ncbi:MAG: hypothetical protein WAN44_17110 [Propionibacteriaceae bacterium]
MNCKQDAWLSRRGGDPIGVLEQRDQQVPDDDPVQHRVPMLQDPRRGRQVSDVGDLLVVPIPGGS